MSDLIESLAQTFSRFLRRDLSAAEMATIIERNAASDAPGICHSHDFCDANVPMDEAFTAVVGHEIIPADGEPTEADTALWNAAWNRAKGMRFFVEDEAAVRASAEAQAAYTERAGTVAIHVWEAWTKNGLNLDEEGREQTLKTVRDAVTNAWLDGITDGDWYAAALSRLTGNPSPQQIKAIIVEVHRATGESINAEQAAALGNAIRAVLDAKQGG